MVITGREPVIVDTGTSSNGTQWLDDVFGIVDPADVRWIVLSHDDADHAGNLPALTGISDGYRRLAEPLGWTLVYDDQYNAIGESTWQPYAQKIADAGVRGLIYVGEPENLGLLVQSLAQIGHEMDWIQSTPNIYDPKLVASAGAALADVPVYTQPYTTSASRTSDLRNQRSAYRAKNPSRFKSGSGRSYGSKGGSWGSSGRSSSPTRSTGRSFGGGRFGNRGSRRNRRHLAS